MAAIGPNVEQPPGSSLGSTLLQVAAGAAAVVLVLALLGGGVVALRLARAHLPLEAGLAAVPKADLIGIGLGQVVAGGLVAIGPLLLGVGFLIFLWRGGADREGRDLYVILVLSALWLVAFISWIFGVPFTLGAVIRLISSSVILLALGSIVVSQRRHPSSPILGSHVALIAFAIGLVGVAFSGEFDRPARFDRITVVRTSGARVAGYLIADTGTTYYVGVGHSLIPIPQADTRSAVISSPRRRPKVPTLWDRIK